MVEPVDEDDRAVLVAAALAGIVDELGRLVFVAGEEGLVAALPPEVLAHCQGYARALLELTGSVEVLDSLNATTVRAHQLRMHVGGGRRR